MSLLDAFRPQQPPPATAATRRLRRLILLTAVATVVVDLVNLWYAEEVGFGLFIRTAWTVLRAIGFLALMRAVRFGRIGARPFGLILAVTTVFAVARLAQPRQRDFLPQWPVLAGFVVLTVLCGLVVWRLYRSPAIDSHLTRRPPRRRVPAWVLTARVAALTYSALLMVPCLIAVGTLFTGTRIDRAVAFPVIVAWLCFALAVAFVVPFVSFVILYGKRWARVLLAGLSVLVLLAQPVLCWLLLGADGLIRDGAPMAVAAVLGLYGLWRTRRDPGGERYGATTVPL